MNGDQNGKYDLEKDFFVLELKAIINAINEKPFEEILKGFFETVACIPPFIALGKFAFDVIEAIEYASQKKEAEILNLVDILISGLEEKDSSLGKAFANLIKKAMRLNEAGIPLVKISNTFEFGHLVDEFGKFNFFLGEKKESSNFSGFNKYYSEN